MDKRTPPPCPVCVWGGGVNLGAAPNMIGTGALPIFSAYEMRRTNFFTLQEMQKIYYLPRRRHVEGTKQNTL